jgi:hypothetical protein
MSAAMNTSTNHDLGTLARLVGCLDEHGFATLAGVKISTLDAWRKRGQGPNYALVGCNYLYPLEAVQQFITTKVRARSGIMPRNMMA